MIGNNLYFFVNGSPDDRLYKSNGSSASVAVAVLSAGGAGTVVIDDVPNCSALVNNVFYFVAQGSDIGEELWRTDGTTAGTYLLKNIAPTFGGINLEDISAPRCFEVEARLREILDIPVFHDDQHGTAIVVLAARLNWTSS